MSTTAEEAPSGAAPPSALRDDADAWTARLHDEITALFSRLDSSGEFVEERWDRQGGGGGVSRSLAEGGTFEKAGVNRSTVWGELPSAAAARLGSRAAPDGARFFATGVSVVAHPRSPMIPTVHLNVRYFELVDDQGALLDRWFGGGTDLTPTYPSADDAVHFHRALAALCGRHHPSLYQHFKGWCDRYFCNTHRGGEARGVGGIFFDHLRGDGDDYGLSWPAAFAFARDAGSALASAYAPIVERRRSAPYDGAARALQLRRRGRYVEFNLLHDRGTLFGLQTGARVESVLMSLPPLASWDAYDLTPGSIDTRLTAMLAPRDWLAGDGNHEPKVMARPQGVV